MSWHRAFRGLAIAILPILVALLTAPIAFGGGSIKPWHPQMLDLDVYRYAGEVVMRGGNIYLEKPPSSPWPFLYPPFAGLLAVPLSLPPLWLVQIGWVLANTLAVLAILYRLGLHGWVLSLVGAGVIYWCEPVGNTLGFGQVGIFLVALVFLDLVPGPRVLPLHKRLIPEGVLTGIAAAIKLTPALFAVFLLAASRKRAAITTTITMASVTILSAIVLPAASIDFWSRLAAGDTGFGRSITYITNQSILASLLRITGFGAGGTAVGLLFSAIVAGFGTWAAIRWYHQGQQAFAISLCGIAGLLASPVSWSHHFVWIVPFAVTLLSAAIPLSVRIIGWFFAGWVFAAPFKRLPAGGDVELRYDFWQYLFASATVLVGIALLAAALTATFRQREAIRGMVNPSTEWPRVGIRS